MPQQIPEGFEREVAIPEGFELEKPSGGKPRLASSGLIGALDAALTVGSNIAGTIGGGAAGVVSHIGDLFTFGMGGTERANKALEATKDAISVGPFTDTGREIVGGIGKAAEVASGVTNNAIANIMDSRSLVPTDASLSIRDRGLSETIGDAAFEAGGPLAGAAAKTLPELVLSIAGTKGIGKAKVADDVPSPAQLADTPTPARPSSLETTQPNLTGNVQPEVSIGRPTLDAPVDITPRGNVIPSEVVVRNIRKGDVKGLTEAVIPDPEIIESAQRLGVSLNPEHYSTNTGFTEVARAIKAQGNSSLETAERTALATLETRANKIVTDLDGSLDSARVSDEILIETRKGIDDLKTESDAHYESVGAAIPNATRVDIEVIGEFIDNRLTELGGDISALTGPEKRLHQLVTKARGKPDQPGMPPTYLVLDRLRKDIGDGFSRRGVFADENQANLSEVYGVLSDVQNSVADAFGVGDAYAAGRRLVQERKVLEDAAVKAFGRDLTNSLVPQIRGAANALSAGDVSRLNKLMLSLPQGRRAEVAATMLGELFAGGSRKGVGLGQGFVATWKSLNQRPTAKDALFRYLPDDARQRFDDVGRVLTGIVRSNQKPMANPSGTAAGIVKSLEDASVIGKIYQVGKKVATAEGASSALGAPGIGTSVVIGGLLAKTKTPALVAADQLLSSPAFTRSINEAIAGNADVANRIVTNSPQYKKWLTTVGPDDAKKIAAVGFIAWLSEDE